MIKSRLKPIWL